jgi:Phage tail assembly chaperone proteins, E, or 41 or 14
MTEAKNSIKLRVPLTDKEGGTITIVTLRRVKVKDIKAMEAKRIEAGDFDATITLASVLSGLALETLEEMDAEDFVSLSEVVTSFLPKAPLAGK